MDLECKSHCESYFSPLNNGCYTSAHIIYVPLNPNACCFSVYSVECTLIILFSKNYDTSYHIHLWKNISLSLRVQLLYHNDLAFPFLQILD